MTDDMFDLGDPSNDVSSDTESDADTDGNVSDNSSSKDKELDPERTPAYDTDYRSNQHTIAALDETWQEVTDLLEDARAYSKLAGYSEVSRLEAYEAMFRLVLEKHDAEEVADSIQTARHDAHDT
jgi:hypothetical protein